jgi:hypothetical protein
MIMLDESLPPRSGLSTIWGSADHSAAKHGQPVAVYRATFAVGSIDEPLLVTLKARIGEQHLLLLHEFCIGDGAFDRYEHAREIGPYLVRPWHSPIIKWAVADQFLQKK